MLIQAIDDLPSMENIKLIFREDSINNYLLSSKIKKYLKKPNIQIIKSATKGQASTCLLGLEDVDLSKPLLISACDNGLIYNKAKFIELTKDNSIDIIVGVVENILERKIIQNVWLDRRAGFYYQKNSCQRRI